MWTILGKQLVGQVKVDGMIFKLIKRTNYYIIQHQDLKAAVQCPIDHNSRPDKQPQARAATSKAEDEGVSDGGHREIQRQQRISRYVRVAWQKFYEP